MSQQNKKPNLRTNLAVYAIVGGVIRYFITIPCGLAFEESHTQIGYYAVPFIIIGIVFSLLPLSIFQNRVLSRNKQIVIGVSQEAIKGFFVGFGCITAIFLLINPCS